MALHIAVSNRTANDFPRRWHYASAASGAAADAASHHDASWTSRAALSCSQTPANGSQTLQTCQAFSKRRLGTRGQLRSGAAVLSCSPAPRGY